MHAWLNGSVAVGIALVVIGTFLFMGACAEGKRSFIDERKNAPGDDVKVPTRGGMTPISAVVTIGQQIRAYLRRRYTLFWRQKVRLLLATGDETAIRTEQTVGATFPLRASRLQWVLRTQLDNGLLALLGLRNFSLPEDIFIMEASAVFSE